TLDGISNPPGRGFAYGNGFDYDPFIGGTVPAGRDALSATITSSPAAPLTPGASVSFTATATYVLRSAAAGQLLVIVRDADGFILNPSATGTRVTTGTTGGGTVTLPAVTVTVPDDTPYLTAEVALAPDGNLESTRSPRTSFTINRPSGLTWVTATDVATGKFPVPLAATRMRLRLKVDYALATSSATANGTLEIKISVREGSSRTDREVLTLVTVPAPPGSQRSLTRDVEFDVPMVSVVRPPLTIYGHLTLKDDAGAVKDKQGYGVAVVNPNMLRLESAFVGTIVNNAVVPDGRRFLVWGEPADQIGYRYLFHRVTPALSPWQIMLALDFLDVQRRTINGDAQEINTNVPVTPDPVRITSSPKWTTGSGARRTVPPGTRWIRAKMTLFVWPPGNSDLFLAARDSAFIDVRDPWTSSATRDVPTGTSTQTFPGVKATLNVTGNPTAGRVTAAEFIGQFVADRLAPPPPAEEEPPSPPVVAPALDTYLSPQVDRAFRLIPIKRYWALYGTLSSSTTGTVTFTYDRNVDFPSDPAFREDSLVVAGLNPLSRALDPLATTLNKTAQTVSAPYSPFYDTYVAASRTTINNPVATEERGGPETFGLDGVYPNPSRDRSVVGFRLAEATEVTLEVYDVLGRRVSVLAEGVRASGRYEATWDGAGIAPGVYVLRLTAGRKTATTLLVRTR
ncbi:MAG TPA: T9SS type A sorting domain-containing protein, partial [Rhodothermales bacterium]|nr:T9SS type A sorting domain-containing protein [Rhodothermales bacterium]